MKSLRWGERSDPSTAECFSFRGMRDEMKAEKLPSWFVAIGKAVAWEMMPCLLSLLAVFVLFDPIPDSRSPAAGVFLLLGTGLSIVSAIVAGSVHRSIGVGLLCFALAAVVAIISFGRIIVVGNAV